MQFMVQIYNFFLQPKLTLLYCRILRNNSFSGNIPVELAELKELEVLDLGYNNFSGPFPSDIGNNLSLSILWVNPSKFWEFAFLILPSLC